jgi:hypothetical protein
MLLLNQLQQLGAVACQLACAVKQAAGAEGLDGSCGQHKHTVHCLDAIFEV